MSDMDQFFTADAANEGVKLPLTNATGGETDHYLVVLGVDSDVFRRADAKAKRDAFRLAAIEDEEERITAVTKAQTELVACLVSDWSFDQECTHENVVAFLNKAPQIAAQIDTVAGDRRLFFALKSES